MNSRGQQTYFAEPGTLKGHIAPKAILDSQGIEPCDTSPSQSGPAPPQRDPHSMITTSTDFSSIQPNTTLGKVRSLETASHALPRRGFTRDPEAGGPTSCRKGPRFQMHIPASVVGCAYIYPCDCMHKGRSNPQRNSTLSRLFAIDYIKSSAVDISILPLMEHLGDVRNTRLLRTQACWLRSVSVGQYSLKPLIIRCASTSVRYQHPL